MKFSLSWLKAHLQTDATLETIVETLTAIGLEVDGVEDRSAALAPFRVAYVVSAEPHPQADRLRVCIVETHTGETVQVVCGAPNARAGMKGVFAPSGTHVPGTGLDLKPTKIRGVESNGMLCSERELMVSDDHDGIIDLPADTPIGTPFAEIIGADDPVIDIELTPNRPDCASVRGIARDLAAAGLGTLKPLAAVEPFAGSFDSPMQWAIADDDNYCSYVCGRYFRGLKNGPSPRWLQDRLRAIGLRPISALVDITNYVTIDLGRPLHVFDAAKLSGDTLTMRRARADEELAALNGKTYALDGDMTVIADAGGVHGIGGVMGGEPTGCTETTTEMFLECAMFAPVDVAATGRKLNLQSDARYRFERGLDATSADWGAEVAARLVLELCGGEVSHVVRAGTPPPAAEPVTLRHGRVARLAGVELAPDRQLQILRDLGFEPVSTSAGEAALQPPPWRPDIHGEADLIEEIVRIHGLDKVAAVPLDRDSALPKAAITPAQRRVAKIKRALAAQGLHEAVTWSFMARKHAGHFGDVPDCLALANPISADLDTMRPSILPNLILAVGRNMDRGYSDLGLFEVGPQYRDDTPEGQARVAAGIRQGNAGGPHWAASTRAADALDAKADVLAALAAIGAPAANAGIFRDAPRWYHPGRSASLRLGKTVLAYFGEVHPGVLAALDVKGPIVGFELFLDDVPLPRRRGTTRPTLHLSPYQPVTRDFAFIVDAATPAGDVLRAARSGERKLVTDAILFDVYTCKGVPEGKKSLALTVTLQPTDATLTDEQIEAVSAKILASVEKQTGGVLRS